ncbi:probable methyltransferase TARBP1 isoform X6 [Lepidochelys kempii]|uniref:probable methyltransferase TARBP1 isoform X6 n=1 Tax=Lepidochelys kempii TaxID=8472 RepID=UPI003C6ECA3E
MELVLADALLGLARSPDPCALLRAVCGGDGPAPLSAERVETLRFLLQWLEAGGAGGEALRRAAGEVALGRCWPLLRGGGGADDPERRRLVRAACGALRLCARLCGAPLAARLAGEALAALRAEPPGAGLGAEAAVEALVAVAPELQEPALLERAVDAALALVRAGGRDAGEEVAAALVAGRLLPALSRNRAALGRVWEGLLLPPGRGAEGGAAALRVSRTLLALTALADLLFPGLEGDGGGEGPARDARLCGGFWRVMQKGLTDGDGLCRKRARYLLKRAVEVSDQLRTDCTCPPDSGDESSLFWWSVEKNDKLLQFWENYILIMETLEGNQIHVIKPVLPKLNSLYEYAVSEKGCWLFHPSWHMCIYKRMFESENKTLTREGVAQFLELYETKRLPNSPGFSEFIIGPLMDALSESSLYGRSPGQLIGACPPLGMKLQKFLSTYLTLLPEEEKSSFLLKFIQKMTSRHWCAVPILFLSMALACIPSYKALGTEGLHALRDVLQCTMITHQILLRGAAQCFLLQTAMHLTDVEKVSLPEISSFLMSLRQEESLSRGTILWMEFWKYFLRQWVSGNLLKGQYLGAKELHENCLSFSFVWQNPAFTRITELHSQKKTNLHLCDWLYTHDRCFRKSINCHVEYQERSSLSAYVHTLVEDYLKAPTSKRENCFMPDWFEAKLVATMILLAADVEEVKNKHSKKSNTERDELKSFLHPLLDVLLKLGTNAYIPTLKTDKSLQLLLKLLQTCLLKQSSPQDDVVLSFLSNSVMTAAESILEFVLRRLTTSELNTVSDLDRCNLYLALLSDLVNLCSKAGWKKGPSIWNFISSLINASIRNLQETGNEQEPKLGEQIQKVVSMASLTVVCEIIDRKPELQLKSLHAVETLKGFISSVQLNQVLKKPSYIEGKNSLFEESTSSQGWGKIVASYVHDQWVCLHFILNKYHKFIPLSNDETLELSLLAVQRPIRTLQSALEALTLLPSDQVLPVFHCMKVLVPKLLGSSESLCIDAFDMAWKVMSSLSNTQLIFWSNLKAFVWFVFDTEVLAVAASSKGQAYSKIKEIILKLVEMSTARTGVFNIVLSYCCQSWLFPTSDDTGALENPFSNAGNYSELITEACVFGTVFRRDQRLIQDVHAFVENLGDECAANVVTESTNRDDHYVRVCAVKFLCLLDGSNTLHKMFMEDLVIKLLDKKPILKKALLVVLQWCFNHNFSVRLYALVALKKIWGMCKALFVEEFEALTPVIESSLHQVENMHGTGNARKNWQRIQDHFFFATFHPLKDYSLETIFYTLPRLSELVEDEWIPLYKFTRYTDISLPAAFHWLHSRTELLNLKPSDWSQQDMGSDLVETDNQTEWTDVQKKIIPWKNSSPDLDLELVFQDRAAKLGKSNSRLIVVASLIDKPTNLGGLCRTSEIFGASALVVGSLHYINDKQFQHLSVSAEQWLPLVEVKPSQLVNYLQQKKTEGYTIIGVEQTAKSSDLTEYCFPEKSLLLLGNEHEGIPANLIQHLDVCVEIPQQGIIRSLNVHVSGALLIWEYTRQQLIKQKQLK